MLFRQTGWLAACAANLAAVLALLACGQVASSSDAGPARAWNGLIQAASHDDLAAVADFAAMPGVIGYREGGLTALCVIAFDDAEHEQAVALILKSGADPNARCEPTHSTALHEAVRRGHTGIVKALLNAGADVNARTKFGRTPLYFTHTSPTVTMAPPGNGSAIAEILKSKGAIE